jgi:NADPH:quinone reductase-like Zn-dependent oxidoreductase
MKAVVYNRYGPPEVLRIAQVSRPEPTADEILIKVHAAAVTRADCATRDANRSSGLFISIISRLISGLRQPRQPILGSEFAGTIEALGPLAREFAVGDPVFGSTGFHFAAHAEYLCMSESARVAVMPAPLSFEEAAAITDGGLNSLWTYNVADLRHGQSILIYGASGAIGTAGVQLARQRGAEVTAVCNARSVELVRSLGADTVIDYTREDFTRNGKRYDLVFDAVGKLTFRKCERSLKPGGKYLATDGLENLLLALWTSRFGDKTVQFAIPPRHTKRDVQYLKELVETGKFRPVVDRCYTMEQVVDAARYVETGQKVGNVILTIGGASGGYENGPTRPAVSGKRGHPGSVFV